MIIDYSLPAPGSTFLRHRFATPRTGTGRLYQWRAAPRLESWKRQFQRRLIASVSSTSPAFGGLASSFGSMEGVGVVAVATYLAENGKGIFLHPLPVPDLRPAEVIPRDLIPPRPSRARFIQESADVCVGPPTSSGIPPSSAASCNRAIGNRVCIVSGLQGRDFSPASVL